MWAAGGTKVTGCAVVGGPDFAKGTTPVPFIVFDATQLTGTPEEEAAALLRDVGTAARDKLGSHAAPDDILVVAAIPYTQTGKVARKALQCLLNGVLPARDALKNPAALDDLRTNAVAR